MNASYAVDPVTLRPGNTLQACHRILIPLLGLPDADDPDRTLEALRQTDLDRMIEVLPEAYESDGHLAPQVDRFSLGYRLGPWCGSRRLRKVSIIKLEQAQDLNRLTELGIDIRQKQNKSPSRRPDEGDLSKEHRRVLAFLYQRDFDAFAYSPDLPVLEASAAIRTVATT